MNDTRPAHLYVVEDDAAIREMLSSYLEKQGLAVTAMASAEELLRRIDRLRPDLVVLDINLPGLSGLDACQRLRAQGDRLPIILLTARCDEIDRVLGLELGADDYLAKPFSARELLARIRAVLRRSQHVPGRTLPGQAPVQVGRLLFDPQRRTLSGGEGAGGAERLLSSLEFALLAELLLRPHVPQSRERLLAATHQRGDAVLERTIDTAIMRLRRLIEPNPAQPRYLQTVRGHGYMFVP
ncbi:two-component system phosphate regulon response regulator OmpR [Inhella inkyongensis]|uniref:Two-component system phosphate regulon response regulator OmpR n=1 Tax=Inhella inkyongensis TaxID=392593 RepID=A0A840S219_9BURK|nr:response regulator [Inhella inkyongensis]MBB5203793.1 two-component system phosphate regulon response regulator OmpR [Inhella inkyongensis]